MALWKDPEARRRAGAGPATRLCGSASRVDADGRARRGGVRRSGRTYLVTGRRPHATTRSSGVEAAGAGARKSRVTAVLTLSGISKTLRHAGRSPARARRRARSTLDTGEAAVITGPSGSGKSTLLYIAGGLEPPTSGIGRPRRHQSLRARAGRARALPESRGRLRVSGPLPAAAADGAREHAGADARRRARSRRPRPRARAAHGGRPRARGPTIGPPSSRAARSSARPSRGRWSAARASCCATSRPATSTRTRPRPSPISCSGCTSSSTPCCWSSPTAPALAARFDRRLAMAEGRVREA